MSAVTSRRHLAALAAGLLLSCAVAYAQSSAPEAAPRPPMAPHGMPHAPGGPGFMGPHHGGLFLHGLKLNEAQRDKIFAIEYAQMPELREQRKAIEHARRDLREMVVSGQFDEARSRALTDTLGRAVARETQLRAQADAKILQVLTPEQRKQINDREAQRVAALEDEAGPPPQPMM
ncbi:Spy/CpxP family protein refolding chaperone [Ralstonia solanacearum]|uniref:Spy/CpxP family protein refolding chaperone n=1 Tax=Ralstonia solanacearum TaxID=305 RepID=UPI0005AC1ACE|nr:Spy/CpxP family protein refolding chaperone [Ralstonia solanacearum]